MRTQLGLAGLCAGVLSLAITGAAAVPAAAQSDSKGTKIGVAAKRISATAGSRFSVRGTIRPAVRGTPLALQVRVGSRWRTLDRGRVRARGRYVLATRISRPMSGTARVLVRKRPGIASRRRTLGRLNVYRYALASWYGPGLYGNRTGCGGRLGTGSLGVAHKSLPCGTKVTFRHNGRAIRVPVIDRGPYVGAREYDLTAATARRLGFSGHGRILATR